MGTVRTTGGRPQPDRLAAQIRDHLPVSAVPSIPELRLHRAGPKSGLGRLLATRGGVGPPYWAHVWAGGLVLARWLCDEPATVYGRHVLDLGCGSGLVAIAAARGGARAVTAVDIDPWAVAATRLNAALNGVTLEAVLADPLDAPVPTADLVLVGDLFYDTALAERLVAFLDRCLAAGTAVLIGDPGRTALPLERLRLVRHIAIPDFGTGQHDVPSGVYAYEPA